MKGEVETYSEAGFRAMLAEGVGEHPEYYEQAGYLVERVRTDEGLVKLIRGLDIMCQLRGLKQRDLRLGAAAYLMAMDRGMKSKEVESADWKKSQRVVVGIDKAVKFATAEKMHGKKVGLVFTNYYALDWRTILSLTLAWEKCDCLMLGLEGKMGGSKDDRELLPTLADCVFNTGTDRLCSDQKLHLVQRMKPHIYFGNWGDEHYERLEKAQIARKVGSIYIPLDYIEGECQVLLEV